MSRLWPEGVDHLVEVPWTWAHAVRLAQFFISFDELPDDERPPRRIWDDNEKLHTHFAWVKAERDRKYGGKGTSDGPAGEVEQNQATRSLVVG